MRSMSLAVIVVGLAAIAAAPSKATPLPASLGTQTGSNIIQVWGGCGLGFHPTYWGGCVPNRAYYHPYWRYRYWRYHRWHHGPWHRRW